MNLLNQEETIIEVLTKIAFKHGATLVPLIEPGHISEDKITSSSNHNSDHDLDTRHCRLNYSGSIGGSHAWCALVMDSHQYIQAEAPELMIFAGVSIQGRGDCDQWVKVFRIMYSVDGSEYQYMPKVFAGVGGRNEVKTHHFTVPFRARFVRLQPLEWHQHMSLRWELYTLA